MTTFLDIIRPYVCNDVYEEVKSVGENPASETNTLSTSLPEHRDVYYDQKRTGENHCVWYEEKTSGYFRKGRSHRPFGEGPAVINWMPKKELTSLRWMVHGKYHRTDGPALIEYKKGLLWEIRFSVNGDSTKLEHLLQETDDPIVKKKLLRWL